MDEFEHAEIEPTETDIANLDDMDEATATNTQKLRPQASQPSSKLLTMQQIAELKNLFEEGDLDKNGKISRFELYAMLKKMHNSIDEETVNYLLAKYGNDRNQEINFFNFL